MNRIATLIIGFVMAVIGSQAAAQCATPANLNALASEVAAGVNANRRANGQAALQFNRQLSQAAMTHACDMGVNNFFDHRGSDGSDIQRRVRAAGYRDCIVAENIAWGYPASQQIVTGWMNSAGHRRNMLHPRVTEFGVGISQGAKGPYWVLVVAKGC